jgi:outer membrane usher protein
VGDSISGASRFWGGAVRFGGFQWASNFSTRPGLVTLPLPSISGEATLPSTFDLYVNGALRRQHEVPIGPFNIDNIPVVTGDGEIRVVVRDLLGREQVLSDSYYASPRLLRPGLHDYSYEIGALRRSFGLESNDYGRALAIGTHRVGLTEWLTGEIHGEWLSERRTAGLASALLVPRVGILTSAIAGSQADQRTGGLFSLGLERHARRFSFGGNVQLATESFVHAGLTESELMPRRTSQIFLATSLGRLGSSSLALTQRHFSQRAPVQLVSARHSLRAGRLGFLGLSVLHVAGDDGDTIVDLTFTRSLDAQTSSSFTGTSQSNGTRALVQMQRNAPAGRGLGYRARAGLGDTSAHEAAVSWQNDVGAYQLNTQSLEGTRLVQASASGSLAVLDRQVFPSRRIDSSFAVARVAERAGVRVYSDNHLIGRTNEDGYVLLPGLRAYEDNLISIEQADLPLDVEFDAVQLTAVPYFRSGVLLDFPVRSSRGAIITIVLENGAPLPAGAVVHLSGGPDRQFPVGMNGEVYVSGLAAQNRLQVNWQEQICEIEVAFAPGNDPLPRLGPFVCKGIES